MRELSTKRVVLLLTAFISFAMVGAGCGGDGNGASTGSGDQTYEVQANTTMTTASPPITKPQFIAEMNRICREAWVTVADNFAVYSRTQDSQLSKRRRLTEAIQLSVLAGLDFHIFDNFRILGAPKGEEQGIEEIIGPFQASVELGQKRLRLHTFTQVSKHFSEYNQRAQQYGLNDCLVNKAHLSKIKT